MRYFYIDGEYHPKNNIWGPRPLEGVIFNEGEWRRINDHLVQKEDERDMIEILGFEQERKKQISAAMTTNWENTLASLKSLTEQKRLEIFEKDKQAKTDEYNKILDDRKLEKEAIIAQAKRIVYEDKETTRQLASSLAFSAVLHERERQMKFNKMLRDRIRAAEERYAAEVKKNAEIFEEEQEVEAWKMIDKKGQFRFNLDRQMDYILMKKEFARLEVENEKQDLANMKKKIEKLAAKEKEEKARLREMLRNDIERFNQTEKAIRDQRLKEEEQEKVLNEIFVDTQMKIDDERNTKERNLIKYTRGKLCEKTLAELMPKPKTDDEKFAEEVLKKEENEIKRIEERKTKKERMLKELLEFEKEAVEKAKRDQIFEKEKKKWEVVQKFKRQELDDKWNREERERERARKMEVKDGYIAQWHENAEKRRKEKIDDLRFLHDPKEEVEEVLKYCDKVLDYTKKHGRPSFPVLTTISQVKKQVGIRGKKKAVPFLKSNVPIESIAIYAKKPRS